jgi:6-pyruvoyltetrahydropterin/6-carboxytetrahydropterin synthase
MIIRKLFKFEASHIVRNCYTERCKKNVHGHSYKVEVFLESKYLDNADMVMDFALLKEGVKELIDAFDHSWIGWTDDDPDYLEDMMKWSERCVIMSMNPSAEAMALTFLYWIGVIIDRMTFTNGEGDIKVRSVRVHETDTGYAEAGSGELGYYDINKFIMFFTYEIHNNWKYLNDILGDDTILVDDDFITNKLGKM